MIYLTSNGLSSIKLKEHFEEHVHTKGSVMIITTASDYKEKDHHIKDIKRYFESLEMTVSTLDLGEAPLKKNYDVIYFIGGNPFELLYHLKNSNRLYLLNRLKLGRCIVGSSAGSVVFTSSIGLIQEFSPEMNTKELSDFTGLALLNKEICPHYERFVEKFDHFHDRVKQYENKHQKEVLKIKDGEAIFIHNDTYDHI